MPGCIVSATTASFRSVEKRRLRATPVITSTLENVSDIGTCLGLSLGPPASAGVRSKRGALHAAMIALTIFMVRGSSSMIRAHFWTIAWFPVGSIEDFPSFDTLRSNYRLQGRYRVSL